MPLVQLMAHSLCEQAHESEAALVLIRDELNQGCGRVGGYVDVDRQLSKKINTCQSHRNCHLVNKRAVGEYHSHLELAVVIADIGWLTVICLDWT